MKDLGGIDLFLKAIGLTEGDAKLLPVVSFIGGNFELEEFKGGDVSSLYYRFLGKGVELGFQDSKLRSVIFFVQPYEDYLSFVLPAGFVSDLVTSSSRDDVLRTMGVPVASGPGKNGWLKFAREDKFLHLEFDEGSKLTKISVF